MEESLRKLPYQMDKNYISTDVHEYLVLGFIALIVGAILSFIAIGEKEKGYAKYFSILSLFVILSWITWFLGY